MFDDFHLAAAAAGLAVDLITLLDRYLSFTFTLAACTPAAAAACPTGLHLITCHNIAELVRLRRYENYCNLSISPVNPI